TSHQRLYAARMKASASATDRRPGSKPPSRMLSSTSGSVSARSVPARSFSLIGPGVPLGTAHSDHEVTTKSGKPASTKVGALGTAGDRWAPLQAMALSLPATTWAVSESILAMHIG